MPTGSTILKQWHFIVRLHMCMARHMESPFIFTVAPIQAYSQTCSTHLEAQGGIPIRMPAIENWWKFPRWMEEVFHSQKGSLHGQATPSIHGGSVHLQRELLMVSALVRMPPIAGKKNLGPLWRGSCSCNVMKKCCLIMRIATAGCINLMKAPVLTSHAVMVCKSSNKPCIEGGLRQEKFQCPDISVLFWLEHTLASKDGVGNPNLALCRHCTLTANLVLSQMCCKVCLCGRLSC